MRWSCIMCQLCWPWQQLAFCCFCWCCSVRVCISLYVLWNVHFLFDPRYWELQKLILSKSLARFNFLQGDLLGGIWQANFGFFPFSFAILIVYSSVSLKIIFFVVLHYVCHLISYYLCVVQMRKLHCLVQYSRCSKVQCTPLCFSGLQLWAQMMRRSLMVSSLRHLCWLPCWEAPLHLGWWPAHQLE